MTNIPDQIKKSRRADFDLHVMIDTCAAQFQAREKDLLAFLPEPDRFKRLHREADTLLQRYPEPEKRPPLFGLLFGVKDIFHVDDFETRAGSKLPVDLFKGEQAEVVTRLKAAGALMLGKTVTTEFAYFAPGPTRNPHHPKHTPGGSSSGSAAAVGGGLLPFAFGTQTIGSISRPASYCGVVGLKPTFGRISMSGVIPVSHSVDHVGYFTADVQSARFMAPYLYEDWQERERETRKPVLGVPQGGLLAQADETMLSHFESVLSELEKQGYTVRRVEAMPDFDEINDRHNTIVSVDAAGVHKDWFREHESLYHPKTADLICKGLETTLDMYKAALPSREKLRNDLAVLMDQHGIDLWLSPGSQGAAPEGLDSTGSPIMNMPWTHCGLPTVTLPMGINETGLPLGLQVAGGWCQDEQLLDWALELEKIYK